ncbi:phage holin family protein [Novosphingobium sp. ZN18A2]|uniref:phage holin family protein n=1 Tax=Novosphingobium sp. ZN18A2 TaxID=3079861 RepID=UPI0030CD8A61
MDSSKDKPLADKRPDEDGSAEEPLVFDSLRDLIDDGQTLVQAELAYQQSRIVYAWGRSKIIAGLVVLGLAFFFFTLMALVVGLLLAIAPLFGKWGALAVVTGGLALLTALCLGSAIMLFRKARTVLLANDDASGETQR